MTKLEALNICKTLDGLYTLDNISLYLKEQELVVIVGPSGCGKSTLFHIISGLINPDTGRIIIDGRDHTGQTGRVGYMQQKDLLLPFRTVLDNIALPLVLKGESWQEARKKAKSYLSQFGLEGFADYYPRQLSGGMKQRAALLRTYLFASDILLLDEPFAALDAITRHKMQKWLLSLRNQYNPSILFITHDIEEALLLADRIYVFSPLPGRVVGEFAVKNLTDEEKSLCKKQIMQLLNM
ncbi:ABC-type nitrate/sulfonate/bicarbonate transport system, ATPase component [Thermosyntropha lipolytica DSM 11003]|uniref:ABC-type nitrate/sulfonate/bicarbonate transport system, ATPase component n=1 Tax=Thermosyntropha lipolytica DSM 11003 TaxID=1123382 RepID=A0A1M5M2Q6_9FIRM|nr:ABC transporter ATP-binding protein [Thermosyntropha lipolytica]SHG71516.1 ABC-type nitrate/sulfonate/bicarbonate transport system, ATPase component [Thermosyntropha lipolytica DSM 11003]